MHSDQNAIFTMRKEISRRSFLKTGLLATAGLALPVSSFARVADSLTPEKNLSFYNTHTGEKLKKATYWAQGEYIPGTLDEINYILRDFRADEIKPIDPQLLDLLHGLSRKLATNKPFHIISGFRSPATNSFLRRQSQGVAKHSLHMEGKAIDIRMPGCDLTTLHRAAKALKRGGVGLYPASDFVHVDTGRVRYWHG